MTEVSVHYRDGDELFGQESNILLSLKGQFEDVRKMWSRLMRETASELTKHAYTGSGASQGFTVGGSLLVRLRKHIVYGL